MKGRYPTKTESARRKLAAIAPHSRVHALPPDAVAILVAYLTNSLILATNGATLRVNAGVLRTTWITISKGGAPERRKKVIPETSNRMVNDTSLPCPTQLEIPHKIGLFSK